MSEVPLYLLLSLSLLLRGEPGSNGVCCFARLVVDQFFRGWRLMKKKRSFARNGDLLFVWTPRRLVAGL